jgi:hypothetical protein
VKFWFNLQQTGYFDSVKDTLGRMDMFFTGVREDMYIVQAREH